MNPKHNLDLLYKKNFSVMVARLLKKIGIQDIGLAEDIIQETFLAAHQQWPSSPPENPEAWLYRVSSNIAFKNLKGIGEKFNSSRNCNHEVDANQVDIDPERKYEPIEALLLCARLPFSPKHQVVFALRYAASFKIDQIAFLLGSTQENVSKILHRMRNKIKNSSEPIISSTNIISERENLTILKILYLMFSEGYKTSRGRNLINEELCEDALTLTQALVNNSNWSTSESKALLSLMLFNLSRFESRFGAGGEIIDLEEQDRTKWHGPMIQVAIRYLNEASTTALTSYHIEAAIAYVHCSSVSFNETAWSKIVNLYEKLSQINESPFIKLSMAIARFYSGESTAALLQLEELGTITYINNYHLYQLALGKIFQHLDEKERSLFHFRKGLALTSQPIEKQYIEQLISKLEMKGSVP